VRLIEIRLLEGPNVYRLEPVVKIELAIGRRRTFYGERRPGRHALVRLGATVPAKTWPDPIAAIVAWVRRLRTDHGDGLGGIAVHRSSDPGHWIVTFPWMGAERAQSIAEAALALAERDVSPSRTARLTGHQERAVARWSARIEEARTSLKMWFAVDTLEYLRRGGRIGAASAWLGSALKIKPILTLDKEITPIERVRTGSKAVARLLEYGEQRHADGADGWVVQHIQAPEEAQRMVDATREIMGRDPVFVSEVGPVIGAHVGPGLLGIGGIPLSVLE